MEKIAIYCRISTEQQSTDRQKQELTKYAKDVLKRPVADEDIYTEIISGYKKGELRPEYSRLKTEVEAGNIDTILFSEFTRVSRTANELLNEIQFFKEHEVSTYFQKQDLWVKCAKDFKSPIDSMSSNVLLHLLAVMAEYEVELFNERSLSGKINKIKNGNGGGLERAFGYMHNEKKQIVINPNEAETVVRIFDMYANGYSTIQICQILDSEDKEESRPPYYNQIKQFKANREKKGLAPKKYKRFDPDHLAWRTSSLSRILHNELYKGIKVITMYKPDPKNTTPIHKRTDRGEPVFEYKEVDENLRIISDELFERVKQRLLKAHYNKNNAMHRPNLLKDKIRCGECGSNFSVGKQTNTATNYKTNPRTYRCYGVVKRKDHPRICSEGMETRQCRLDGLVLQLSLYMFAQIDIEQTNQKQVSHLQAEIGDLIKVKSAEEKQLNELTTSYQTAMERYAYAKGANDYIKELMSKATTDYEHLATKFTNDIVKYGKDIASKRITIDKLNKLSASYSSIKNRTNEIRNNKELVKHMIDEYVASITSYKIHHLWNLIIIKYSNGEEFWGTIKNARYKNDETFFDSLVCQYGVEFKSWMINNGEQCFCYDKENHTVTYDGKSAIYKNFPAGIYNYEELQQLLEQYGWIGSYPLYFYDEAPDSTQTDESELNIMKRETNLKEDIDWSKHNDEVLKRLRKQKEQEEMLRAFTEE